MVHKGYIKYHLVALYHTNHSLQELHKFQEFWVAPYILTVVFKKIQL